MRRRKKKVMIYAYTRFNLGDDILIQTLCTRYPEVEFLLYAQPEYKTVLQTCTNLTVLSNTNIAAGCLNRLGRMAGNGNLYENLLAGRCDACVCITGSLFIQRDEHWQSYFRYIKGRKIRSIPYFLIGANFGPYNDSAFYESFRQLFSTYEDVCFRERHSFDLFASLPNVRRAPDAVFAGSGLKPRATSTACGKSIAISLIHLADRPDLASHESAYLHALSHTCRHYSELGYDIHLISFCREEGDEEAIAKLRQLAGSGRVHTLFYRGDIEEVITCMQQAEMIVATRFHAMIIGWMLGRKVLPVCYSPKMDHVLEDINYHLPALRIQEIKRPEAITHALQSVRSAFDVERIMQEAQGQFAQLDKWLGTDHSH